MRGTAAMLQTHQYQQADPDICLPIYRHLLLRSVILGSTWVYILDMDKPLWHLEFSGNKGQKEKPAESCKRASVVLL